MMCMSQKILFSIWPESLEISITIDQKLDQFNWLYT